MKNIVLSNSPMIILGIDPGIGTTGFGIIRKEKRNITHVAHGVIKTKAHTSMTERLTILSHELNKVIRTFRPSVAAVEQLFIHKNVKTALVVGEARGVIILTIAQRKLPVREFTPLQIKQALTGYGRASKSQIQQLTQHALHLSAPPTPDDAADALAVALTCAHSRQPLSVLPAL